MFYVQYIDIETFLRNLWLKFNYAIRQKLKYMWTQKTVTFEMLITLLCKGKNYLWQATQVKLVHPWPYVNETVNNCEGQEEI